MEKVSNFHINIERIENGWTVMSHGHGSAHEVKARKVYVGDQQALHDAVWTAVLTADDRAEAAEFGEVDF